jgi:thioredoxin-related protein
MRRAFSNKIDSSVLRRASEFVRVNSPEIGVLLMISGGVGIYIALLKNSIKHEKELRRELEMKMKEEVLKARESRKVDVKKARESAKAAVKKVLNDMKVELYSLVIEDVEDI